MEILIVLILIVVVAGIFVWEEWRDRDSGRASSNDTDAFVKIEKSNSDEDDIATINSEVYIKHRYHPDTDSLFLLSKEYNTTLKTILQDNLIKSIEDIKDGSLVIIRDRRGDSYRTIDKNMHFLKACAVTFGILVIILILGNS